MRPELTDSPESPDAFLFSLVLWSLVYGLTSGPMAYGLWTKTPGPMAYGLWTNPWSYGLWSMD